MVDQRLNKVEALLCTTLNSIKKWSSCIDIISSHMFRDQPSWWRLFFNKVAGLEFIPAISLKMTPRLRFFYMDFAW